MINALVPWLAAIFSLLWAYPWARWLLSRSPAPEGEDDLALVALLTPALSLGGLAWLLMMLAAVSPTLVAAGPLMALLLTLAGAGGYVLQREHPRVPPPASPRSSGRHPAAVAAVLAIAAVIVLTLFNAAYWPFGEDDTLSLYGPMAYRFATTGRFGGAGVYDAYPQLVPLAMAYLHLISGGPQEYAGRFVIAVLAMSGIGAAYVLGRDLYGRTVGLAAAYLLATTPILPHWAASAYTDVPAGTHALLAMIFAWRLSRRPGMINAALAGLLAGLAAFTKNGALLIPAALAGWVIFTHWLRRTGAGRAINGWESLLLAGGILLAAGPWYVHTSLAYGYLIPPTGWTDQANRTLAMLLGPALTPSHFLLGGALGLAGVGWQAIRLWRARPALEPRAVLLLGFGVPFWLVWWLLFSYDLRFLLLIWGVFAVMGADLLLAAAGWLTHQRWLARTGWLTRVALPLAIILLALPTARMAVDHKLEILRDPFMSDDARHAIQLGGRWPAIRWLRTQAPPGSTVLFAEYHFYYALMQADLRLSLLGAADRATVTAHDYWIAAPGQPEPPWAAEAGLREILAAEGYRLYEVP
ncbi:MAG: hypothetical protein HPY64_09680 [Anaerolineae bacterium]|nr:hypothetical protein [Anaerolineae bacterium]